MYDPISKKVHICRDVIVDEHEAWKWETNTEIKNANSHIFTESDQSEASDEDMEVIQNDIETAGEADDEQVQ